MRTYLIIYEFSQKRNKKGEPYGWHLAQLATPETKWGYDFVTSSYGEDPLTSWKKIRDNIIRRFPRADDKEVCSLLGMRVLSHEPTMPMKSAKSSGKQLNRQGSPSQII